MQCGGGDNVQRIGVGGGFGHRIKHPDIVFGGDFAGGFQVGVKEAGELHEAGGGEFGVQARVLLAERPNAQHRDAKFVVDVKSTALPAT